MNPNTIWRVGAVVCGLGVILGAFGAHWLETAAFKWYEAEEAAKKLGSWETGVRYQLMHGLALLVLGSVAHRVTQQRKLNAAFVLFVVGTLLFSGSLYLWMLTNIKVFVMIVPLGGLAFILGWVCMAMLGIETLKSETKKQC